MVESTLGELLVRAEGATALHSNKDGIPPIKQGLAALQQRTADLAFTGQTVQGTEQAISKARQFLPSGHTDDLSRLVTSLERKPSFQPAPRARAPGADLESYLEEHYRDTIQKAIEEAQEAAEASAHRAEIRWEEEDWREAKLDFRKAKQVSAGTALLEQTLALTSQFDDYQQQQYDHQQQQEGGGGGSMMDVVNPSIMLGMIPRAKSKLSKVQQEYAAKIGEATTNQSDGLANLLFLAADRLARDSQGVSADAEEYKRTLRLLRSMLEQVVDGGVYRPVLDETSQQQHGVEGWREILAVRAREHLEREIYEVVETRTRKALAEGRCRISTEGPQGILEAYVEYKTNKAQSRDSSLPNPNPYEVLYWFLRTGHSEQAVTYVSNAPQPTFPSEVHEALVAIHAAIKNRPALYSGDVSQAIGRVKDRLSMRQDSEDVFERAVLNLLAFDNPNKVDKQQVVQITEDYLWHCLWFTLPINPANADPNPTQGRFTIFDLAAKILRWGERYFDPDGGRAFLYARILFICQLFREGVSHLYKNKHLEAVHTAILLDHYGLFRDLSRSEAVPPRGYVMNIEDIVLGYIKDFQDSDGEKAADYLLILRPWPRMKKMVEGLLEATEETTALPRLAAHLKSKSFQRVSVPRPGSQPVTESWGPEQALEVIKSAAVTAERSLSSRKALALYQLAEDDTGALRVLNKQLCQVWWKEVPYFQDKKHLNRDQNLLATLDSLCALYGFFDDFDRGDDEAARDILENNLNVFPLMPDARSVENAVTVFMASSIEFKRVLGEAATRAMRVWLRLYHDRKKQGAEARPTALSRDGQAYQQAAAMGQEQQAREMQLRAKALLKWCLDLRVSRDLPSEIISRLQRMEASII